MGGWNRQGGDPQRGYTKHTRASSIEIVIGYKSLNPPCMPSSSNAVTERVYKHSYTASVCAVCANMENFFYEDIIAAWKIITGSILSGVPMLRLQGTNRWTFTVAIYAAAILHFDWPCKVKF